MITRWLAARSVDPETPLTVKELRDCINEAYGRILFRQGWVAIGMMAPVLLVVLAGLTWWVNGGPIWLFWIVAGLVFPTFLVSAVLVPAPFVRKSVRRRVRARGVEVCVSCGYWLRGLEDSIDRCPECGAERVELLGRKRGGVKS